MKTDVRVRDPFDHTNVVGRRKQRRREALLRAYRKVMRAAGRLFN